MTARIFIVEAHRAVRNAYVLLLQREPGIEVCGAVASGEEALRLIPHRQPDLVLVTLPLSGMNSLTLLTQLYQAHPRLPLLIASSQEHVVAAIRKSPTLVPNVKGYLHRQKVLQQVVPTIQQVLAMQSRGLQAVSA